MLEAAPAAELDAALPREAPLPEDERLVAAFNAFAALRTPPVEEAVLPLPPAADPEESPPKIAELLLTVPVAEELEELEELPAEELPLEEELELEDDPPPPPPPPPPPLLPMKAPLPPEKLRLPRSLGPVMVTYFSGAVVPVSRMVCVSVPGATFDVRTLVTMARFAAMASSASVR